MKTIGKKISDIKFYQKARIINEANIDGQINETKQRVQKYTHIYENNGLWVKV